MRWQDEGTMLGVFDVKKEIRGNDQCANRTRVVTISSMKFIDCHTRLQQSLDAVHND